MSLATIVVDVEKGVEVVASDALAFLTKAQKASPAVLAALGVLAGALNVAITDVEAAATDPATLTLSLGTDIAAVKQVWPDVVAFLGTIGIKV